MTGSKRSQRLDARSQKCRTGTDIHILHRLKKTPESPFVVPTGICANLWNLWIILSGPEAVGGQRLFVQVGLFGLVDADATGLDYPETSGEQVVSKRPEEGVYQRLQDRQRRVLG